jgi:ankyrin repeat protein
MKKLFFVFLGLFVLCAFNSGLNKEELKSLKETIQQVKQEQNPAQELCNAVYNSNEQEAIRLLDKKINVNSVKCFQKFSVLFVAIVINQNVSVIEKILQAGANPKEDFLLDYAITNNSPEQVEVLLKYGGNTYVDSKPYAQYRTFLYAINPHKNLDILNLLIKAGADINALNEKKETILDYTIDKMEQEKNKENKKEYTKIIQFLIDNGAKKASELENKEEKL